MFIRDSEMADAFGTPVLSADIADVKVPNIDANKYAVSIPASVTQPKQTSQSAGNYTEEVANPFIDTDTSVDSQRPIVQVGTLIASKQSLRELKKEMDIIDNEKSRWR